jgi:hypothetical protein
MARFGTFRANRKGDVECVREAQRYAPPANECRAVDLLVAMSPEEHDDDKRTWDGRPVLYTGQYA